MCIDPKFMLFVPNWDKRPDVRALIPFALRRVNQNELHLRKDGSEYLLMWLSKDQYEWYYDRYPRLREFLQLVPCRKCVGCQLDRKDDWATRCLLEAQTYGVKKCQFVTFTYRDEDLPEDGELRRRDFQLFMKRLRKWCAKTGRPSPRVFYRGEYGEKKGRCHFHAILFNISFGDLQVLFWRSKRGKKIAHAEVGAVPYSTSPVLASIWTHGNVIIAPVTLETIKYVANYLDKGTSRTAQIKPFNGYSNRPAIGKQWFDSNIDSYFKHIGLTGKYPVKVVRYFNRKMKESHALMYDIFMQRLKAIVLANRPWERIGLTELEYRYRYGEVLKQKVKRRKKDETDIFFDDYVDKRCRLARPPTVAR